MATEAQEMVRSRLMGLLLDKVDADTYPSSTMLDMIELLMTPDELEEYAAVLLSKVDADTYPSVSMINRLIGLT